MGIVSRITFAIAWFALGVMLWRSDYTLEGVAAWLLQCVRSDSGVMLCYALAQRFAVRPFA